ncbi:AAA family ATPase [Carboxylicivirga sp. RSCT41]|uniref:AAA family ATPase n=1 Tax=Carboxylicivirga agarovorans TaxID=3417570 RepID=UPI003D339BE0
MAQTELRIDIKSIRSVKKAKIALDGISVITGVNGSGKSTISKLVYHIIKTSIEYDYIVREEIDNELRMITKTLDQLTRDLSYLYPKDEYPKLRNTFRKITSRDVNQLDLFENNSLIVGIDFLIRLFREVPNYNHRVPIDVRVDRIKRIIGRTLKDDISEKQEDVVELLYELRDSVKRTLKKAENIIEYRPIGILKEKLSEAFEDNPVPNRYNIYEYGTPIIDRDTNQVLPLHSIENVAYIDTPMILGIDTFSSIDRKHWDDLNEVISNDKSISNNSKGKLDINEIIKGEISKSEEEISDKKFIYKRSDGQEFDLLECATGLKSFAILQILFKNDFLRKGSLLIIDEPEVHLHPQWIVEYARLIILLHKHVGVNFLIASHNPDMISAIKYISEKETNSQKLNFYLAEQNNDFLYNYRCLGTEIDEIFESFNIALERIDMYGKMD